MTSGLANRALAGLEPGHHACCSFQSERAQGAAVGRFALEAFGRGERLICTTDRDGVAKLSGQLRGAGLDVKDLEHRNRIEMRVIRPTSPDTAIASLQQERRRARTAGFSGIALIEELHNPPAEANFEQVVVYERMVKEIFVDADVIGLCLYDRREFSNDALHRLVAAHDVRIDVGPYGSTVAHGGLAVTELETGEVAIGGELDIAVDEFLGRRLQEHVAGNRDLVLDVGGVTFIDATGCRVLFQLADALPSPRRLILSRPTRSVARSMSLCGWLDHPRIVLDLASVAEAAAS